MRKYTLINIRACVLALISLLSVTIHSQERRAGGFDITRGLETFADIYRQIDMYYVDTISADTALRWAIDGMLMEVDPFTNFIPISQQDEFRASTSGRYAGIGAMIRAMKDTKRVVISEPYQDCPAARAGVKAGDIILSIDGKDVEGWKVEKVSENLRGEPGTKFELKVERPGTRKPLSFKLVRENIKLPAVTWYDIIEPETGLGYIYLSQVTDDCAREVRKAVTDLKAKGMKSLLLDLRDNPGGAISQAVEIVGMFVPKGSLVVSTKGKLPSTCYDYLTPDEPIDTLMPLHVLVNGNSASAAEIISGAWQDLDRATIWGRRTYGKGLVQAVRDVPYRGKLKITTARYYIPSGRCIQAYDYRHRSADGAATHLPDSLTREFHTRNGRTVRDGGGILPDSLIELDTIPTMVTDLYYSDQFFDYVTDYVKTRPSIATPDLFSLSDEEYEAFADAIAATDFKYNGRSATMFSGVRQMARAEGLMDAETRALADSLEARLKHKDVHSDLMRHRQYIQPYLEEEITNRYYHESGSMQLHIRNDKEVRTVKDKLQYTKN
ncbi:MAG: S41 family peptidase [Bacteroidaceae bacterium]|nr:S41 family peptidase [Bacteroidaceae bacterium]